jgi:hypothetical protein
LNKSKNLENKIISIKINFKILIKKKIKTPPPKMSPVSNQFPPITIIPQLIKTLLKSLSIIKHINLISRKIKSLFQAEKMNLQTKINPKTVSGPKLLSSKLFIKIFFFYFIIKEY